MNFSATSLLTLVWVCQEIVKRKRDHEYWEFLKPCVGDVEIVEMKWIWRAGLFAMILAFVTLLIGLGVLIIEGKRRPDTNARYVALGSSFAAGLGLGARAPSSPIVCQRSLNGYPQQLARLTGISLADMTCSGATVRHVLHGGQYFQGPQIDAVGPHTELVTLTAGGNDVGYVGDLVMMSYRGRGGFVGHVIDRFWKGAKPVENRQFSQLQSELIATFHEIAHRAPRARIFVVTYPVILPPAGTCDQIGIGEKEAALMRDVGTRLAEVTREAAKATGVTVVDMASLSAGHDACSTEPWVNGAAPERGALFHPTLAGAQATAKQIMLLLEERP